MIPFEKNPSEVTEIPWLFATNKTNKYPPNNKERSGKWLIFSKIDEIDALWEKVKKATEEGLLGGISKVATAKPNANYLIEKVICVYSYNIDDEEDVMRIREELRKIGFNYKLPYKLNSKTRSGKYQINGDKGISSYYI